MYALVFVGFLCLICFVLGYLVLSVRNLRRDFTALSSACDSCSSKSGDDLLDDYKRAMDLLNRHGFGPDRLPVEDFKDGE